MTIQTSNTTRPDSLKSLADVKYTPFWLDVPNLSPAWLNTSSKHFPN